MKRMPERTQFIEIAFSQTSKYGQDAPGDVFVSHKTALDDRTVCVLADGLGSGIKANVLATLTATMALKFVTADIEMKKASEIIMSTLPICSKRKIGYSTFTIMDLADNGEIKIMEYDNPSCMFMRGKSECEIVRSRVPLATKNMGMRDLWFSGMNAAEGDRLIAFTDGVSQSGIGRKNYPLGWTEENAKQYVREIISDTPDISARNLAKEVVSKAVAIDGSRAKDDISCAVVYFRKPRELMLMTGPPVNPEQDKRMAAMLCDFEGEKIISGGTTANIISRETGRKVEVDLSAFDPEIPPSSKMHGIDLVTEGTITLSRVAELLEKGVDPDPSSNNSAEKLLAHLIDNDIIRFVVGTKINDAHQDPNLPAELDIRRNLIKRIINLLHDKYMKETHLSYI